MPTKGGSSGKSEFKIQTLLVDAENYIRLHILPLIPSSWRDLREEILRENEAALRFLMLAAFTKQDIRREHLNALRAELSLIEVHLEDIRLICYKKRKITQRDARRFQVCAGKLSEVDRVVYAWIKNESERA